MLTTNMTSLLSDIFEGVCDTISGQIRAYMICSQHRQYGLALTVVHHTCFHEFSAWFNFRAKLQNTTPFHLHTDE